jgi:hypothetical protein
MNGAPPEAPDDPIAVVVDLVAAVEPAMERPRIEDVVRSVAGGRFKCDRLAQALVDHPQLLREGRSPAPRAAGDLLIALQAAGAVHIGAPVCAGCDKPLRSMYRRGQDWWCWVCARRRETCAGCGQTRSVTFRDLDRRPRCGQCSPEDGHDPLDVVVEVVAELDPTLPAEVVRAAVRDAVPHPGRRPQLAWAVVERPELLTGAGAEAPVPAVLRLIDNLRQAGSVSIMRPPCPHCGRLVPLVKPRDGLRLCSRCAGTSRAEPCSRCPAVRQPATRDEHGQPICRVCLPRTITTCAICGSTAPCVISRATGRPWCRACRQRWARCTGCDQVRPVRGGTRTAPLCSTCTRPDPGFWRSCEGCGQPGRLRAGRCARCRVRRRLDELLAGDQGGIHGEIHPGLQALHDALARHERPDTVADWLDRSATPAVLRSLAGRPLTHQVLDELPDPAGPVGHLRAMMVATGCLPPRDEHLARLERWITDTLAARTDPDEQHLLHRYAVWHLLRRLRGRLRADTTANQAAGVRTHVTAALTLLDWLADHDLTLATANQGDLEAWLTNENPVYRGATGDFVRWAHRQKLTRLELPATRWDGPTDGIDTETRWQQARRLLHDNTVQPEDRVAGLLVLLYAQRLAPISRLTLDHLEIRDHEVRLRLGHEPVVLPEPLADLVRQVAATRRGHAALADPGTSRWLFPGGRPGQPIHPHRLGNRLHRLGLQPAGARSAALFQLAADLPAAILARTLGIHIDVAVAWQRAAAGDWTAYAADVSRRTTT